MKRFVQIIILMIAMLPLQSFKATDTIVYICVTGKVYHATKDCRGLANATHKIKAIPLSEAKKTRKPCKICY